MAKRQTRVTQNHVGASPCRFKSDLRHYREAPERTRLLAYVVGVALGDGNLSNPNRRAARLRVTCDARYPLLARKIARSLHCLFPRNRVSFVRKRGNCLDINCYSTHWESLLGWQVGQGTKVSQDIGVPTWIMQDATYAVPCLRGLLETDGTIYCDRGYAMVMFASASKTLARDVEHANRKLGFAPRTYTITANRKRPIHRVRLAKDVGVFLRIVRPRKR